MFKIHKNYLNLPLLILLIVLLFLFSAFLRRPVILFFKPALSISSFLKRQVGGIIFYNRSLNQVDDLKKEVEFLKYKINSLNEFYLENLRLKESLSLKDKSVLKLLSSRVIARSADSWSSNVTIDKGSRSGIRPGMGVMTYLGLAGRVIEVTGSTSKVVLLSDPNLGVSGIIQRSRQEGLVSGTLGASLIMRYLPEDADIRAGDTVISSGLNGNYPKGILIGRVIDTGKEFSGLSRYALVKPAVNLSNFEEVLIVVP